VQSDGEADEIRGVKVPVLSVSAADGMEFETFESEFEMHWLWRADDPEALLAQMGERVRGVQAVGGSKVDAALIQRLPALEIISCFGVGYDGVDVEAAKRRGVVVTNTPGVLDDCVADLAIGLMISASRGIARGDRFVRAGKWLGGPQPLQRSVSHKRLGILGLGRIGRTIAERATAFSMDIAYHARRRRDDVSWPWCATPVALAERSDFLVVVTPGGAATRHLVDEAVLRALGPEGILVNVARGSVVDEEALLRCLEAGALRGAGLDVYPDEPRVSDALLGRDDVVLAPHIGSATLETRAAMSRLTLENLREHFAGRPVKTPV
jgi:lactate dehydrogenase-like 2-hydroxyacid dehydrogenase